MAVVLESSVGPQTGLVASTALPSVGPIGDDVLLVAFVALRPDNALTVPAGWTVRANDTVTMFGGGNIRYALAEKRVSSASPPYGDTFGLSSGTSRFQAYQLAFRAPAITIANIGDDSDEYASPGTTDPTASVALTAPGAGHVLVAMAAITGDTGATFTGFEWPAGWVIVESFSGGSDLGPSEVAYKVSDGTETSIAVTARGTLIHSVVLLSAEYTITTDAAIDSPPYEAPPPGAAIIEIYASEAGAARWGEALWGEAVWSSAGWQDVTPETVDVDILWGSQRPELGILSSPDPASWAIQFHDPDRTLDPANGDGPYYGDLQPGLPVRVSHNGTVVKQGVVESMGYQFSREFGAQDVAYMRVTDIISVLGNARVPTDSTLADTLFARARDAISASGLVVTVLADPPSGDPDLAPWITGQDMSAWEWIMDAAQSVLWQPYVTNVGHLGFRPYATPLDRGRVIASPNLVGLQSIIEHAGLYSVVTAQDDTGTNTFVTRELTPKPRYGAREYIRENATPDAGDWALAVLRDRANAGLRWVPGEVYPLTASDVHDFATIEAIEIVSIVDLEADPAIIAEVIVVGGRVHVQGKKDSEAVWDFTFEAAQTATQPLVTEDLSELLVRDDDPTEYLYPD